MKTRSPSPVALLCALVCASPALSQQADSIPAPVDGEAFLADLVSLGVPANGLALTESELLLVMDGSLSEGDSLLKHYGGVYYTLLDSIGAGWPVLGLRIAIDDVVLLLDREYVLEAIDQLIRGVPDDQVGLWVLEHTLLEDIPGSSSEESDQP